MVYQMHIYVLTFVDEPVVAAEYVGRGQVLAREEGQGDGPIQRNAAPRYHGSTEAATKAGVYQVGWVGGLHLGIHVHVLGTASAVNVPYLDGWVGHINLFIHTLEFHLRPLR